MSPTAHAAPTYTAIRSDRATSTLNGARPRRAVGVAAGALAALAFKPRVAFANQDASEAEDAPLADLSLSYSDSHGPGQLMITPVGVDAATGGTAVSVHLAQARGPFAGPGFARRVDGRSHVIAASVTGVAGVPGGSRDSYFLSGTLSREDGGWRGHGRWSAVADPSLSGEWHAAEWPAIQPARPQLIAGVRIEPVSGSSVSGGATLVALPEGETGFELQLRGLTPGATYGLHLRGGTPAQPSASFTQLATVTADSGGRGIADGLVRFRGTDPIALLDIAGGDHFLAVVTVGTGQTVAAGAIPALQPLG